ncbi:sigma 54-interacting transcriptional regulator [Desulfovibrio mangrovi]|uniref:sigma-54 interaction domain-containing protein n=1 Tax=Desulfovibrio mangrovi TaxID=2976983 RepID=UPI002247135D|nr:sigma 54-interacting transcriptional regulator [Desulfovibrio mangrovi]UZP67436.1 sigma 54-interacting transcriptional regulator [Desulfovibrio mangrovi]
MSLPGNIPCEAIMQSIADGVFTVDRDWNVTFFNKAAEAITGIPASEALGRKCWEVLRSSLCDGQCALEDCIAHSRSITGKSIFIVRTDGTRVPVSISASPLKDASGELIGGVETFRDLTEITLLRKEMEAAFTFEDIIGKSPALRRILNILPQIAQSDATVLITGESGTGKERIARALHNIGPRAEDPFVAVNCGALPETLLESELFGYKAGAFTDAKRDKAGRFKLAQDGTVFLDEIGDIPHAVQVKLLRVLQERSYEPLGAVAAERTNARIIAATNADLEQRVREERFRQDLFYRLNVVRLHLPPLRERTGDIPLLADHFIRRFNTLKGKEIEGVSEDVLAILMRHGFPGNIRELENILEYAFILASGGFIQVEHLPEYLQPATALHDISKAAPLQADAPMTMAEIKCRAAHAALARNGGRRMTACRELDITKDTLRSLLQRCPNDSQGE